MSNGGQQPPIKVGTGTGVETGQVQPAVSRPPVSPTLLVSLVFDKIGQRAKKYPPCPQSKHARVATITPHPNSCGYKTEEWDL